MEEKNHSHLRLEGALGLCLRAGRCVTGSQGCQDAIRKGEVQLLVVDPSISDASREQWENMCRFYQVRCQFLPEKEMLSRLAGRENRRVAAVTDSGFARMLGELLENNEI